MRVVAAGVHDADFLAIELRADRRAEGEIDFLGHRQRVHVGAEGDDGSGAPAFEHADDASAADTGADLDAELAQMVGDERRSARLLSGELGMLVHVSPPSDHTVVDRQRSVIDLGRQ